MVVGLLGGLAYVAVFALATFVKHQPREIVVTVPSDKFVKQPPDAAHDPEKRAPVFGKDHAQRKSGQADGPRESRSRRRADRAVPRHAGGRTRRRRKHACRLSQRSRRPVGASAQPRRQHCRRRHRRPARILSRFLPSAASSRPRWRGGCRRCASSTAFSTPKESAPTIRPRCSKDPSAGAACRKCSRSPRSTAPGPGARSSGR